MKTLLVPFAIAGLLAAVPCQRIFAQNQHEMTQSATKDFEKADAELNRVYKKLLDSLDEDGKAKLVKAQRAWIAYRDAESEFAADEARGGSMAPMLLYGAQAKMTRQRVAALRERIAGEASQ